MLSSTSRLAGDGRPTERLAATLPRVSRDSERLHIDGDVDDRLLVGEGFFPAARPPTETVTHWDGWSR